MSWRSRRGSNPRLHSLCHDRLICDGAFQVSSSSESLNALEDALRELQRHVVPPPGVEPWTFP